MTRKDYQLIADTLKKSSYCTEEGSTDTSTYLMFRGIVNDLADTLQMDKELLKEMKKYIEECEESFMWEYSSNIEEDEKVLFADKKSMPKLYFKIIELLKGL